MNKQELKDLWTEDRQGNKVAEYEENGFLFRVKLENDDNPDYSYIGKFVRGNDKPNTFKRRNYERGEYEYIHLTCDYGDVSRKEFRKYRRQDYDRMEKIANGDVYFVGIVVTVYKNGVELGYDSVWGFELENYWSKNEEFITEEALSIAGEALDSAKRNLSKLCLNSCEK